MNAISNEKSPISTHRFHTKKISSDVVLLYYYYTTYERDREEHPKGDDVAERETSGSVSPICLIISNFNNYNIILITCPWARWPSHASPSPERSGL